MAKNLIFYKKYHLNILTKKFNHLIYFNFHFHFCFNYFKYYLINNLIFVIFFIYILLKKLFFKAMPFFLNTLSKHQINFLNLLINLTNLLIINMNHLYFKMLFNKFFKNSSLFFFWLFKVTLLFFFFFF